jgi:endoglucanase
MLPIMRRLDGRRCATVLRSGPLRSPVALAIAFLLLVASGTGCGASRRSQGSAGSLSRARPTVQVSFGGPALRRGMNLGNALDAPKEGEWGVVLDATDFVSIKQAGFDHVRLPVRFSSHAASAPPYAIDESFLERVDWAVDQAALNGLAIIVDLHHYKEMMDAPDEQRPRFVGLWKQIAERYRNRPPSVAFELLNEPSDKLTADKWNDILADALRVVRASNPSRTIIVEGVFWASAHNLRFTLRVPPDDPNLVGSFHMYQPMVFTHQGAHWMSAEYQTVGVVFPGPPAQPSAPSPAAGAVEWVRNWFNRYNEQPTATNPSGPAAITEEFDIAQAFAERTHLPVYLGEFGAIENADPKSREAWTRMARIEAEHRGFGWAYWDDGGGFKAYDRPRRSWVPYLKSALLD